MPFSSLLWLTPGIGLIWEVEGSCGLIRASGAASREETQWLKPRKLRGEPCVCPLALMLLVNRHKQETPSLEAEWPGRNLGDKLALPGKRGQPREVKAQSWLQQPRL